MLIKKRLLEAVSRKDYLHVVKALDQGVSPNADWKGMLPVRIAVLIGDIEMVALFCAAGADAGREPTREDKNEEDGTLQTLVVGKSAHALATEMANDISNPLHLDAKTMLQVMAEPDEAKRRVMALQARLEEQVALEVRWASRNIALIVTGMVCVGVLHWYFGILDSLLNAQGSDPREL